jgi:hypothetical protein
MSPFVDRDQELASLEDLWGPRFQLALLWGRRRVGKTRLLDEFATGKPAIIFQADEGTAAEQLARFTGRLLGFRDDPLLRAQPLASWDAAMVVLTRYARDAKEAGHPLLVVLDEFPRLVVSNPRLPSLLQSTIEDVRREDLPLFLVLAGSQVSLFERHVLHGPLYGRRTWGAQLAPLDYRAAAEFFPDWSPADRLRAWGLLGGIPYYLEQWDPSRGLAWNIVHRLLSKGCVLFQEAELILKEELSADAAVYQTIIGAVAGGATRPSDIGSRAGLDGRVVSRYLDQLRRLHLVERMAPAGAAEASRRGIWRLADHYLRSWFEFVRANRTDLEAHRAELVYASRVRDRLDAHVSRPAFEDAAREHARRSIGVDPGYPARATIDAWWGPVPDDRDPPARRTREAEVDIVGYDGKRLVLAGEAKWSRGMGGRAALEQLRRTAVHVPGYDADSTRLVIYMRDASDDVFRARSLAEGVIVRTVADMFG